MGDNGAYNKYARRPGGGAQKCVHISAWGREGIIKEIWVQKSVRGSEVIKRPKNTLPITSAHLAILFFFCAKIKNGRSHDFLGKGQMI